MALQKPTKPPTLFTSDRYALAQVALYIFALVLGVSAAFQLVAAFATPASQIPAGMHRIPAYAIPATQNGFWSVGFAYLSYQLQVAPGDAVWRLCVGIMSLQICVLVLQLFTKIDLMPIVLLALAIFGLGSLFVGKDPSRVRPEEP